MQLVKKNEMISTILESHDYYRDEKDYYISHSWEEIVDNYRACIQKDIKSEFSIMYLSSMYNFE